MNALLFKKYVPHCCYIIIVLLLIQKALKKLTRFVSILI